MNDLLLVAGMTGFNFVMVLFFLWHMFNYHKKNNALEQ